jgi:hypothetical protein
MTQSIKVETTQSQKQTIEIPVPSFYKDTSCTESINDMLGLIDKDTFVRVWESQRRTFVENSDIALSESNLVTAFNSWTPITEEEFLTAYDRALKSMSLTPELSMKNYDEETIF